MSCKKKKEQAASFFLVRLSLTQVVARSHSSPSSLVVKAASDTLSSSLDAFPLAAGRSSSREGEPRPTSPTAMARVTHGVREEKREKIASLPAKCLSDVARRASSVEKAWLLEPANSLSAHLSQFDTTSPPTTSTKLTLQGPVQPLRSPKRAAAYARSFEGGAGPSGNYGVPSMQQQQQPKRECSSQSIFNSILSLSSPVAFPAPFRSPPPPRGSRRGREELGGERRGNGRELGESFERRIRKSFHSFSALHSRASTQPPLFFFPLSSSTSTSTSLSLSLSLFHSLSLSLTHTHIKKQPRGGTARAPSPSARSASTSARPSC